MASSSSQRQGQQRWLLGRSMLYLVFLLILTSQSFAQEDSSFANEGSTGSNTNANANVDADPPSTSNLTPDQRQQLLEVHQSILQSSDPQQALMQVADANNMSPQELADLLNQNSIEMQQSGVGANMGGGSYRGGFPSAVLRVATSLSVVIMQYAKANPRSFGIACAAVLTLLYMLVTAPRTGLVLSSGHGLLSRGHTTFFLPPMNYINRYLKSPSMARKQLAPAVSKKSTIWIHELEVEMRDTKRAVVIPCDDGDSAHDSLSVRWYKKFRKSTIKEAATARVSLLLEDFLPDKVDDEEHKEGEESDKEDDDGLQTWTSQLLWEAALNVVSSRRWTEFVPNRKSQFLRVQALHRYAMLVLPGSGDWRRYGLVPLKSTQQHETETKTEAVFSTLRGSLMEGHLRVHVRRLRDSLDVGVDLVIPKRGRKLPKRLATQVVSALSQSIATSIETETRKRLARQGQNSRFQRRAHDRAAERRRFRHEKEQQLEEMAADRRRRRHRQNPDAGRYRPSGRRMQSPNNAMY